MKNREVPQRMNIPSVYEPPKIVYEAPLEVRAGSIDVGTSAEDAKEEDKNEDDAWKRGQNTDAKANGREIPYNDVD